MQRPCTALFVLLATLAASLVAGPKASEAGSLGDLAVAMKVVDRDCDESTCDCPLAGCPEFIECDDCAIAQAPDLNAAASDTEAVDPACDECYGVYGNYCDDYANQYDSQSPTASDSPAGAGSVPQLNPPECDGAGCFDDYGVEYADQYECESPDCEETTVEQELTEEPACEDDCGEEHFYGESYDPYRAVVEDAHSASASEAPSSVADEDLIVDFAEPNACPAFDECEAMDHWCDEDCAGADDEAFECGEEEASEPQLVDPYDAYGRQVGDDDYSDAQECNTNADCYGDDADCYGDCYGDCYEVDGYICEDPAQNDDSAASEATEDDCVESCPGYDDGCYGDCYDYYYGCEQPCEADEVEQPSEAAVDEYGTDYDRVYDEAVYGPQEECVPYDSDPPPALDEAMLEDESEYDVPAPVNEEPLVDDQQGDLPWADVVDDQPSPAPPVDASESEYGSDYAEDYYGSFAHDVELPEGAEEDSSSEWTEEAGDEADYGSEQVDDSFEEFVPPLYEEEADSCSMGSSLDVSRLATSCGRTMAAWSQSLVEMTKTIHAACRDLTHTQH